MHVEARKYTVDWEILIFRIKMLTFRESKLSQILFNVVKLIRVKNVHVCGQLQKNLTTKNSRSTVLPQGYTFNTGSTQTLIEAQLFIYFACHGYMQIWVLIGLHTF